MKKIILCMCLLFTATVTAAEQPTNDEQLLFTAWCDAYTAQGLLSLAANRIYGHISTLSDEQYEARRDWINENYSLADQRFNERTGHDYFEIDALALENGWTNQCQITEQIK